MGSAQTPMTCTQISTAEMSTAQETPLPGLRIPNNSHRASWGGSSRLQPTCTLLQARRYGASWESLLLGESSVIYGTSISEVEYV